jgi:2-aminoethylphosphonate-pyruvate transaminase
MQAVILAAGSGTRLRPLTENLPKGLIQVGEKTLLEYSLDGLKQKGIDEVIIVAGFKSELLQKKFSNNYNGLRITYIFNHEYARTGSMYSLSKAKDSIKDKDILLLESDLLFDSKAVRIALNSQFKDLILVADISNSGDEVYICVDNNHRLTALGKNISEDMKKNAVGELMGISRFSKEFLEELFKRAEEEYCKSVYTSHYEECVFAVNQSGCPVYAELCKGLAWIEIDRQEDLEKAVKHIYPRVKKSIYEYK